MRLKEQQSTTYHVTTADNQPFAAPPDEPSPSPFFLAKISAMAFSMLSAASQNSVSSPLYLLQLDTIRSRWERKTALSL